MHTETHKNKRTNFLNRETIPYFIFSEIERQIFEGVGFGFFFVEEKVCDSGSCVHDSYRNESPIMTHKI